MIKISERSIGRISAAAAGALCAGLIFAFGADVFSQTKAKAAKRKPAKAAVTAPEEAAKPEAVPVVTESPKEEPKKNSRPTAAPSAPLTETKVAPAVQERPEYTYTFTRPGFTYERIVIEHDDSGKGTFTFQKLGYDEEIADPLSLTAKTMATLRSAFEALDFLNSTESYQVPRDYSHMGTIELTLRRMGRERTARYNWTDNKQAKVLMDEYRRIANEFTWRFEIASARDNQPLQAPGLMNLIESYVKRNDISDPKNLVPFLTQLASDERLPLMARNKAADLVKYIEKTK